MIIFHEVSKFFGSQKAVDNISFQLKKGENFLIVGSSGSGKTTCLKMCNGLEKADKGTISFKEHNLKSLNPIHYRKDMGYVIQENALFPHLSVKENISISLDLAKSSKESIEKRVNELMDKMNLPQKFLNKKPSELSGGEQQRVGIARALANKPSLLLMDEPFGALDPITRNKLRNQFLELDELKGKSVIMVTHDIEEAFEMADQIMLMNNGKSVFQGKPIELLKNNDNDYINSFTGNKRLSLLNKLIKIGDLNPFLPEELRVKEKQSLQNVIENENPGQGRIEQYIKALEEYIRRHELV